MGQIKIIMPDELETVFRKTVNEHKGLKKGKLKEAITEAITDWITKVTVRPS